MRISRGDPHKRRLEGRRGPWRVGGGEDCLYNVAQGQSWGKRNHLCLYCHLNTYFCSSHWPARLTIRWDKVRSRNKKGISVPPILKWITLIWTEKAAISKASFCVKDGIFHHTCAFFQASHCHPMACKCKGLPRGDLGKIQDSGTVNRKGERTYGRKLHKRG